MIRRAPLLAVVLAACLLAPPARADEADAETRFHDAYVLEVIDGKIAEAAKGYLDLLRDERVETRIRDEARFRFAVCTVLLGRPDEGRMQLAAIVSNERVPQPLRDRAKAYMDSISTLGVGTELQRKLDSLVFDLGRANPADPEVPAYRDFEIIGRPAVPFLEKLLRHEDANLRRHAFRLLIRLGEEDMVARWTPQVGLGRALGFELSRYLSTRPEEEKRLEAKLLALDDRTLSEKLAALGLPSALHFSLDFVKALLARPAVRSWGFAYLPRAGTAEERWATRRACLLAGDDDTRRQACIQALEVTGGPPDAMVETLWSPVLDLVVSMHEGWTPGSAVGSRSGNLEAWARRISTPLLLASLEKLVAAGEAWPAQEKGSPLRQGLAALVAGALEGRELDAAEVDAYEALVKRWVGVVAPALEPKRPSYVANAGVSPLRSLIERLPEDRARALVRWLFAGPAHEKAAWFVEEVEIKRPVDVALLVEAVEAADPADRDVLVQRLPHFRAGSPSEAIARAEVEALPGLLRLTSASKLDGAPRRTGLLTSLEHAAGRLPDEVVTNALRSLFETAASMGEETLPALFDRFADFRAQTADGLRRRNRLLVRFVLPALQALSAELPVAFRHHVLDNLFFVLRNRYPFEEGDRERLAAYVLGALDDVETRHLSVLAAYPDLFPLERWIPRAEADAINIRLELRTPDVDRAVKALATDPAKVDDATLAMIVGFASPEVGRPVVDAMLRSPDAAVRHRALSRLRPRTGYPASPEGLEAALAGLLAEEAPDLDDLAHVADLLSRVQPSERLLPAAERLLGADERKANLRGILLAKRLGRASLVPALARLLDSLDADLRDQALGAIQAIRELERLQAEAQPPR